MVCHLETMLVFKGQTATGAMPIWVPCHDSEATMTSMPGILPRTMSGFVVLPQPESVLMFVACVSIKGHEDAHDLSCHL